MKKIIYSLMACAVAMTVASCDPLEKDSHALEGALIAENSLSFTVTPTENINEYLFTNTSAEQPVGVRLFWDFDGKKLVETTPGDAVTYVYMKKGQYTTKLLAFNEAGQTAVSQTISIEQDMPEDSFSWPGFGFDSDANLFKNASFRNEFYYADAEWASYGEPAHASDGNKSLEMSYDKATVAQWQNQVHFYTDIAVSSAKTYDYSVVLKATKDIPAATAKVSMEGDDTVILFLANMNISLKAGESKVVYGTSLPGFDGNAQITFDFGGNSEGTDVVISDITLMEHNDANVAPLNYDDAGNLWKEVDEKKAYEMSFWWSDASWAQIGNPEFEQEGNVYTITANATTAAEWQAQNTFNTGIGLSGSDVFDFCCLLGANKDARVTIKICQSDNDDNQALYVNNIQLKAGVNQLFMQKDLQLSGGDAAAIKLIVDLGGCQEGTVFKIGNITIIKQ